MVQAAFIQDYLHELSSVDVAMFCNSTIAPFRRQIDITTYQIRKIKADTSLCLFADDLYEDVV